MPALGFAALGAAGVRFRPAVMTKTDFDEFNCTEGAHVRQRRSDRHE